MWVCHNNILVDYLAVPNAYLDYSRWVLESRRHGRELSRHILVPVLERFLLDLVVSRTWYFHFFFLCDWFNSDGRGAKYPFPRALDVGSPHTVRAHSSQVIGPGSWNFVIIMNLLHSIILGISFTVLWSLDISFTVLWLQFHLPVTYVLRNFMKILKMKIVNLIERQVWWHEHVKILI